MSKRIIDTLDNIPGFLIKTYSKKLAKNPSSRLFLPLADIYRFEGMIEEAFEVSKRGVEMFPDYGSARVMLGLSYLEFDRVAEAEEEFKKAEALCKDNLLVHNMLYEIYRKNGDLQAAAAELKKVLAIYPEDKEAKSLLDSLEAGKKEQKKEEQQEPAEPAEPVEIVEPAETVKPMDPVEFIGTVVLSNGPNELPKTEEKYGNVEERKKKIVAKVADPKEEVVSFSELFLGPDKAILLISTLETWLKHVREIQEARLKQ